MKKQIRIKYPKLLLLLLSLLFAYILFKGKIFLPFHNFLLSLGYLGAFFSGFFYSYGFTAAPATAILLILAKEHNIIFASLIAGFGALIGSLIIFFYVRYTLRDELTKLSHEPLVHKIEVEEAKLFGKHIHEIKMAFAGFLIASPLPTEIGISLMSSIKRISIKKFAIISYLLNTAGIFVILIIGNLI